MKRLLRWFRAWLVEGQDSALRITGIRQSFIGYDYEQGQRAREKWLRETPRGRMYQQREKP